MIVSVLSLLCSSLKAAEKDDQIEASAKKSYVFKTFLAEDTVTTKSKDGAVTLTGTVNEASHKMLAQETVSALAGVKSVDNKLDVKQNPAEDSDTWLFLKVKSTLAYHRSVSAYNTEVDLNEGVVTLKGEAVSLAQKELTTEYVNDVEGVKEVKNEMTVAATAEKPAQTIADIIDDASITAQVKMALLSHRSTSAFSTTVTTTEGVVTVGGKAKNTAERDLVTKLVSDIKGVRSVVNSMTIATALSTN